MTDYRITCIRRDGNDADRRIDAVGIGGDIFLIDQIINWIQSEEHRFWVSVDGVSVWVEVRQHQTSLRYYLATENDGFPPNNLLSLPECP
jgi:hypothetical protein